MFTKISCPLSLVGIPCGKECHGNTTSAWHEKLTAELLDSRGGASVYPLGSGARGKMSSPGTARDGKIETTKGRTGKTGTKRREKGTDNWQVGADNYNKFRFKKKREIEIDD